MVLSNEWCMRAPVQVMMHGDVHPPLHRGMPVGFAHSSLWAFTLSMAAGAGIAAIVPNDPCNALLDQC